MQQCLATKEKGAILITALLFIFIFTILTISALQISALEAKMSAYFENKTLALIDAENSLKSKEDALRNGFIPSDAKLISNSSDACGIAFYQLKETKTINTAKTTVQSVFAKITDNSKCTKKYIIKEGRQSWKSQ